MPTPDWLIPLGAIEAALPNDPAVTRIRYALRHGTMRVGLYAPRAADIQTPHTQDELYIVVSGTGFFEKEGDRQPVKAQDLIFVEAGAAHHFEDLSEDFSTWVIFWGKQGGEGGPA